MEEEEYLDARVEFYLKHRSVIDEWLTLPDLMKEAADNFFRGLADPLAQIADTLSGPPELDRDFETSKWQKLLLHLPSWKADPESRPRVAVNFEWRERSGFHGSQVGIWVDGKQDTSGTLGSTLVDMVAQHRRLKELRQKRWWPAYKPLSPRHDKFWTNLDGFRQFLLGEVTEMWESSWEHIDNALRTS